MKVSVQIKPLQIKAATFAPALRQFGFGTPLAARFPTFFPAQMMHSGLRRSA